MYTREGFRTIVAVILAISGGLIDDLVVAKESDDHKDAIDNADKFLDKFALERKIKEEKEKKKYPAQDNTGVNRSVFNQKAFDEPSNPSEGPDVQNIDKETFMAVIEKDAKDRAARKRKQRAEANIIKEQGNEQFKKGNYQQAVDLYTQALSIIKDIEALWTNRAQAYIKLEEYDKAINDCEWALRVNEKCLKAFVHQGKALAALGKYTEAIDCFNTALEVDPSKHNTIQGYLKDVELQQQASQEEKIASEAFNAGGNMTYKGLVDILEKINTPDNLSIYYSGGLRLVKNTLKNTTERTLFRTNGGLSLTDNHPYISRCFRATPRGLSQDEVDLCTASLEVLSAACVDNEENQRILLENTALSESILRFLESKWKATRHLKEQAISFLHLLSERDYSRPKLISQYDTTRLLSCIFVLMKSKNSVMATTAVGLLNNMALDNKFKIQLRDQLKNILPAFEGLMTESTSALDVLPSCLSTVTNLCADTVIRRQLIQRPETWQACCKALGDHVTHHSEAASEKVLFALLGLLMNLTLDPSTQRDNHAEQIAVNTSKLLRNSTERLEERACGVLSHVLPHSEQAVNQAIQEGAVEESLRILQKTDCSYLRPALKFLVSCTQHSTGARDRIFNAQKGVKTIYSFLKHHDEHIVGNSALCLGYCTSVPGVTEALVKTDVMKTLIVLTRDSNITTVKQNCAILIGKLAQHPSHLEELRALEGMGILHQLMEKHFVH